MGNCCGSIKVEPQAQVILSRQSTSNSNSNNKNSNLTSFEFDFNEWIRLVNKLQANKSLKQYAFSAQRSQFQKVNDLIRFLSNYKCETNFEKAWLIYVWITANINYNVDGFRTGDYGRNDAESVLRTGCCVCEGYARLYMQLCEGLGLECRKITGYAKGFGYRIGNKMIEMNHAWNALKIENRWYFVEATWGSGQCTNDYKFKKIFNPMWFLTPSQVFMYDHYCEYFQLQKNKITLKEFENLPLFGLDFHLFGLKCLTHYSATICSSNTPLFMEFSAPKETLLIADLKKDNNFDANYNDLIENSVFVQRDSKSLNYGLIIDLPEKNKTYKLSLYGKHEADQSLQFESITNFLVSRNRDDSNENIPKYSLSFDYGIKCESHFSELIRAKTNPVNLVFSAPLNALLIGDLRNSKDQTIDNNSLVQRTPDLMKYEVKIVLPNKYDLYEMNLFAKKQNEPNTYEFLCKFKMTRSNDSVDLDKLKFVTTFPNEHVYSYLYSPLEYYLKANKVYSFKLYVKNVFNVALVDQNSKWMYMKNNSDCIWTLEQSLECKGELTIFIKETSNDPDFEAFYAFLVV